MDGRRRVFLRISAGKTRHEDDECARFQINKSAAHDQRRSRRHKPCRRFRYSLQETLPSVARPNSVCGSSVSKLELQRRPSWRGLIVRSVSRIFRPALRIAVTQFLNRLLFLIRILFPPRGEIGAKQIPMRSDYFGIDVARGLQFLDAIATVALGMQRLSGNHMSRS